MSPCSLFSISVFSLKLQLLKSVSHLYIVFICAVLRVERFSSFKDAIERFSLQTLFPGTATPPHALKMMQGVDTTFRMWDMRLSVSQHLSISFFISLALCSSILISLFPLHL